MHQLLELVSAYESALESAPAPTARGTGGDGSASSSQQQDAWASVADAELGPVLAAVLDPLLEACERSAEALTPDAPSRVDEFAKLDPCAHRCELMCV